MDGTAILSARWVSRSRKAARVRTWRWARTASGYVTGVELEALETVGGVTWRDAIVWCRGSRHRNLQVGGSGHVGTGGRPALTGTLRVAPFAATVGREPECQVLDPLRRGAGYDCLLPGRDASLSVRTARTYIMLVHVLVLVHVDEAHQRLR